MDGFAEWSVGFVAIWLLRKDGREMSLYDAKFWITEAFLSGIVVGILLTVGICIIVMLQTLTQKNP